MGYTLFDPYLFGGLNNLFNFEHDYDPMSKS